MGNKQWTRRGFLASGAYASGGMAGFALIPSRALAIGPATATLGARPEPVVSIRDARVKALAQRAVQAAKDAGAEYADVRLTFTRYRSAKGNSFPLFDDEVLHVGVRALIRGYWGFAASPVWHQDEMVRLGREAASLAGVNATGKPRVVDLPPASTVTDGHWETPVRIDTFALHPQEIGDFFGGLGGQLLNELARRWPFGKISGRVTVDVGGSFRVQEKAFASTDGTYCTQRLHWTMVRVKCSDPKHVGTVNALVGGGWEHVKDAPILERIRKSIDHNLEMAALPIKPIDVGRYNAVLDTATVAALLSRTIGAATEIDRALGYEANAGGTSYLNEPAEMLGVLPLGNAHLTVTANRNEPNGVATTRWDDEGVEPEDVTLVKNGVLHDFQTSREGAGWLRETYSRVGRPSRSHGGALAPTAGDLPLIHTANLVMQPGKEETTQQNLEAALGKGMVVTGMAPEMDFQCLNGLANDLVCYEIKAGKRVARVGLAGTLFRTPELWKNIIAVGGSSSARTHAFGVFGSTVVKGEPEQYGGHSVTAVPVVVKDLSFINEVQR